MTTITIEDILANDGRAKISITYDEVGVKYFAIHLEPLWGNERLKPANLESVWAEAMKRLTMVVARLEKKTLTSARS